MANRIQATIGNKLYLISGSENIMEYRRKFHFVTRNIRTYINHTSDTLPYFVLVHKDTGIPVFYPEIELFISSRYEDVLSGRTLAKRAKAIVALLNYILHNTLLNSISEISINDIRDFLISQKTKTDGTEVKRATWKKEKNEVLLFLQKYYEHNRQRFEFKYDGESLVKEYFYRSDKTHKIIRWSKTESFGVKAPKENRRRKNRTLKLEYLEIILFEAKKWDPDLVLAISLQAYAGLRESEVINLTCGSYKEIRMYYESLSEIILNLNDPAPFINEWEKKTDPGQIKITRDAKVYTVFLKDVSKYYHEHIRRYESKGYSVNNKDPLFRNKFGKPMTVQTYSARVKKLFYEHFLPSLIMYCEKGYLYTQNAAYIDAYKEDYPGAHMFRHWFTMYLYTIPNPPLSSGEIKDWRGDGSIESMNTYIHVNKKFMDQYMTAGFKFQEELLEAIRLEKQSHEGKH